MPFLTFRRYYLDKCLTDNISFLQGKVLDIGGKKENKRGAFRPPLKQVESWEYLNTDPSTKPDIRAGAEQIPVSDGSYNTVLLAEILEHVQDPLQVLAEAHRVLAVDGVLVLSMPFLVPVHSDPHDYQRWTRQKLELELQKAGFKIKVFNSMGGILAVIWDLMHRQCSSEALLPRIIGKGLIYLAPLFKVFDKLVSHQKGITTGYFLIAKKD